LSEFVVNTVAFPGMGTGVGKLPPKTCAHQMHAAYCDFIQKQWKFPASWAAARLLHDRLKKC
jgi:O-acetyl-ADP-ribose deacetylase (regulator of RNase III)